MCGTGKRLTSVPTDEEFPSIVKAECHHHGHCLLLPRVAMSSMATTSGSRFTMLTVESARSSPHDEDTRLAPSRPPDPKSPRDRHVEHALSILSLFKQVQRHVVHTALVKKNARKLSAFAFVPQVQTRQPQIPTKAMETVINVSSFGGSGVSYIHLCVCM